jgi:hydrophobic/amphiphilic exporter-1 (mainly G- bacteria), HAE1 family
MPDLSSLLPRFSLDRRVTVLVALLALLVLGTVATLQIPLELIPTGFSSPFLRVAAPWQDAPPQEVLDKVVMPLEEELSTVGGLSEVFSFARTGYGQVYLSFKQGTDMGVAYREVRDRVERARVVMPDDLEQVFIYKDDDALFPVAMVGLIVEEGTTDVYDLIEREVRLPLERIEGVARVDAQGLVEKEILIELDRERLAAAGLDIYELAQRLGRDNFSLASGSVRAGGRKLLLRSMARYRTPADVASVPVTPSVRLGDIATVVYDQPDHDFRVRVNSRPAFALAVMKEGEANTMEVARSIADEVERMAQNPRLRAIEVATIMDQGTMIQGSLETLVSSGAVGASLAMVVLVFFLRRFRMGLIIALSIPLSLVAALVVLYFAGETLNVLSLLGLMISVGMLVDNSVVVAENIHRIHREEDASRRDAVLRGTGEIALAVTTATLTTVVVFLPAALVEGQGQFFLLRLAIPITVSLLASLFMALIVVPLAVYLTLPQQQQRQKTSAWIRAHGRVERALEAAYAVTFGALARGYGAALSYFLRRRLDLVLVLVCLFSLTSFVAQGRFKVVPISQDDLAMFQVEVEMPDDTVFPETEAWFRAAELEIEKLREELGLEYYVMWHQRNWGQIQGALAAGRKGGPRPREIIARILEALPERPGIRFHTGTASEQEKDEVATETVTLFGEDAGALDRTASQLEERLAAVDGVLGIKRATERAPNELALQIDRRRAQRQGVDPQLLAGIVGYALRGQPLPRVYLGGRDIPVRVRYQESDRQSLVALGSFQVPTESGDPVALSTLVEARQVAAAPAIYRRDKQTARRIVLELEDGQEESARAAIWATAGRFDLPEGLSFAPRSPRGGESEEARNLRFAALLSVIFVYMLMGFLFESFVLPLSIVITIPMANLGVTWIHLAAGRDLDFLGLVGVVLLIGVVVNNGIVLIDYVRRLRDRGHARTEALLLATERRFRPIVMTALTTMCGMIPLAISEPMQMGLSYRSFGLTLIGGMATATLLTLLVVPVFYTLFEDARAALARAASAAMPAQTKPFSRA